jgi:hypothetical protein
MPSPQFNHAFRWSSAGGMQALLDPAIYYSIANSVSYDGQTPSCPNTRSCGLPAVGTQQSAEAIEAKNWPVALPRLAGRVGDHLVAQPLVRPLNVVQLNNTMPTGHRSPRSGTGGIRCSGRN